MAGTLLYGGFVIVRIRYAQQKPDGTFFYHRRVPTGLEGHHGGKTFIRQSLQTKEPRLAAERSRKLAAAHDALWKHLRSPNAKNLGLSTEETRGGASVLLKELGLNPGDALAGRLEHHDSMDDFLTQRHGEDYLEARYGEYRSDDELEKVLNPVENEAMRLLYADPTEKRYLLSDARDLYLKLHNKGSHPRFRNDTDRAIQHVIDVAGDLPLATYTREQARGVSEFLSTRGNKTATARRRLRTINAVINKGILEFDLKQVVNPFERLSVRGEGDDASVREPFTLKELKAIAEACRKEDDDIGHIIAMQLDTGARAGEIIGLRLEDVILNHEVPHVWIRPHPTLGRTLKTAQSNRKVPLVGLALWAAEKAIAATPKVQGWLFPRYAADGKIKADSASGTLNKWIKDTSGTKKTSHSFRHAMRDRLRAVGTPEDIQNEIGGWGKKTIAQSYGEGYALVAKRNYLSKIIF